MPTLTITEPKLNTEPKLSIRQHRLKIALKEDPNVYKAMRKVGYTHNTAIHGTSKAGYKKVEKILIDEFKASELTPDWVIGKLKIEAETAVKSGDKTAALALLGKFLGIFTERTIHKLELPDQDRAILDKYTTDKVIDITPNIHNDTNSNEIQHIL